MRPQYAALIACFLDSVSAANLPVILEVPTGELIEKRATNSTAVASPINVEPSQYWDGDDGPWSSFALQVGTPKQDIRVMISTAAFNVWTINAAAGCPNGTIMGCEASRGIPFLTNESLTWVPNSIWQLGLEENLGLDNTAAYGFDTVTLGWQGSGLPTADHIVITNLGVDAFWLGLFGLNPKPTNFSNYNDPQESFMTKLYDNNTIPSLTWAYTAGNQYRLAGNEYGSLVLGGYDQSKFTPTDVTIPFGADVTRDLLVGIQSITTTASNTSLTSASGGFYAYLDSTVSQLWLPLSVCEAFESAFGITYDTQSELYLVNDNLHSQLVSQNASVTFTLGASSSGGESVKISLPYSAFDLRVSFPIEEASTRYFPLKRAANSTQYTLGRTFFQEAYVIADYQRNNFTVAPCKWVQNAATDIRTILSPAEAAAVTNSNSGANGTSSDGGSKVSIGGGAIAGIVIGAVATVALIGAVVWYLMRKRWNDKKRIAELEAKSAGTEMSDLSGTPSEDNATKPFISSPIGGELGTDNEIHEMQESSRAKPVEIDNTQGFYGPKGGFVPGTMMSANGSGVGTWQSGLSEVEGNNEPIYEMMGSEVQELPDSRRQSWADGDEKRLNRF